MTLKKVMLGMATVALSVASAAGSYDFILSSPAWVGNTELKPGSYKLTVDGEKAIFKTGKTVVESTATVETAQRKFEATSLDTADSKIKEIHLGGTKTKLVFKSSASTDTNAH